MLMGLNHVSLCFSRNNTLNSQLATIKEYACEC